MIEPLSEGYSRKGGQNGAFQFEERPPAPTPVRPDKRDAQSHLHVPDFPFQLGQRVHIDGYSARDPIEATVIAVCLRAIGWEIQISWMHNGDLKEAWVAAWRLKEVAPAS